MSKVKIGALILFMGLCASNTLFAASDYVLDSGKSSLYFASTKQNHVVESHFFTDLSGSISDGGVASLSIDLSSVETGVQIRNQRVRDLLFEVATFSNATVTLPVDMNSLDAQAIGNTQAVTVSASLNLHGFVSNLDAQLIVTKLSDSIIMVQNGSPVLINAGVYGLDTGVDALRDIANLDVISHAVPVNFTLLFNKSQPR